MTSISHLHEAFPHQVNFSGGYMDLEPKINWCLKHVPRNEWDYWWEFTSHDPPNMMSVFGFRNAQQALEFRLSF
jgi:hypothetical protein